jgi:hypothetical protein
MLEKLKHILKKSNCRPIFVIGTGRSGTHWLGHTIENHPEIRATIESQPMFGWSTEMALNPKSKDHLLKKLLWIYKWHLFRSAPWHYLDKSHPNIWIAEKLKKELPNALFIGIERNPYATVASMMKHKGVSAWHKRWRKFPVPNRFLGINSKKDAKNYDNIPFASQCAMRWLSHHNEMNALKKSLKHSLLVINYESLAHNTREEITKLKTFLELTHPIPIPDVKTKSLNKWKNQLSKDAIRQIYDVVGFLPEQ